jgi:putative oxidoreductase
MTFLSRFIEPSYALLRIVSGAIFTFHGVQKIFGILTDHQPPLGSQLWIGGMIELVCGILIVIGYQTRFSAFLSSGTMAVAYFQFHWKFRMGPEFFPAINGGDAAILYCFVFLYIACRGGGIWAFDKSS